MKQVKTVMLSSMLLFSAAAFSQTKEILPPPPLPPDPAVLAIKPENVKLPENVHRLHDEGSFMKLPKPPKPNIPPPPPPKEEY